VSVDPVAIGRLRARLAIQIAAPLVVSARSQQYLFDEDSAAYAEIDIKRHEAFIVVVVIGSLPSEQFIVDVWHRFAREVWLLEPRDHEIYVARPGEPHRLLDRSDTLRSPELPGVAVPIDALFSSGS
jgi:hypothetical protein